MPRRRVGAHRAGERIKRQEDQADAGRVGGRARRGRARHHHLRNHRAMHGQAMHGSHATPVLSSQLQQTQADHAAWARPGPGVLASQEENALLDMRC